MKRKLWIILVLASLLALLCAGGAEAASKCSHQWTLMTTRKEPSCTQEGTGIFKCDKCGARETRTLPARGHSWSGWKTAKAASCLASGEESRACSACGKKETRTVAALGHTWGLSKVTTEPGLLEPGVRTYTCSRCGATSDESIPVVLMSGSSIMDKVRGGPTGLPVEDLPNNGEEDELRIVTQPVGGAVGMGESGFPLYVEAAGGCPPYTYHWRMLYNNKWFNVWHDVENGNDAYAFATWGNYLYACEVTDSEHHRVTSNAALVTWDFYIEEQPHNANLFGRDFVTLSCRARGGEPYGDGTYLYLWYNDAGEQISVSNTGEVSVNMPGEYYCVIEDAHTGRLTTQKCTVYVTLPLHLTDITEPLYLMEDEIGELSATVSGGIKPYKSAWKPDDPSLQFLSGNYQTDDITGDETFTATVKSSGKEEQFCIFTVTDAMGETLSAAVPIRYPQLEIARQPQSGMIPADGDHFLGLVMAEGELPLTCTVYRNGEAYAIVQSDSLEMDLPVSKGGEYICYIEDSTGRWAHSETAYVDDYSFQIEEILVSGQLMKSGDTVTLIAVTNEASEPIEYSWSYIAPDGGEEAVSGMDNSCSADRPGTYRCFATDAEGREAWASATVEYAGEAPIITRQPESITVPYSENMSKFSYALSCEAVAADGSTDCLTYAWECKTGKGWGSAGKGSGIPVNYDSGVYAYRCVVTDTRSDQSTTSNVCYVKSGLHCVITYLSGDMKSGVTIRYIVEGGTAPYWVYVCASREIGGGKRSSGLLATDYISDSSEHTHKVTYDQYFKLFEENSGGSYHKKGKRPDFYLTVEDVDGETCSTDYYPGK